MVHQMSHHEKTCVLYMRKQKDADQLHVDSWSQDRGFESHQECCAVSFSKTLRLHCFVLFKPIKTSQHDLEVKPQLKQTKDCTMNTLKFKLSGATMM